MLYELAAALKGIILFPDIFVLRIPLTFSRFEALVSFLAFSQLMCLHVLPVNASAAKLLSQLNNVMTSVPDGKFYKWLPG